MCHCKLSLPSIKFQFLVDLFFFLVFSARNLLKEKKMQNLCHDFEGEFNAHDCNAQQYNNWNYILYESRHKKKYHHVHRRSYEFIVFRFWAEWVELLFSCYKISYYFLYIFCEFARLKKHRWNPFDSSIC